MAIRGLGDRSPVYKMGTCRAGWGELGTRYTELSTRALSFNKKMWRGGQIFQTWHSYSLPGLLEESTPLNRSFLILGRWGIEGALGRKGIYWKDSGHPQNNGACWGTRHRPNQQGELPRLPAAPAVGRQAELPMETREAGPVLRNCLDAIQGE